MITAGDIDAALERFPDYEKTDTTVQARHRQRAECAWKWITEFAPADFRFDLKEAGAPPVAVTPEERAAIISLRDEVSDHAAEHTEQSMAEAIYRIADETGVDRKRFFAVMYQVLIGKERGPRLAGFLLTIGAERVAGILSAYE
jgi:lysyl-tRNA synthetase class 1